ncbi:uncharacterized protein PAC_07049 [Phialocephala subalpina]|uniref:Uncharacterized protein n=1 Tax=Phialocephala subalpina TaxID=576137 RepID=A0A1L7WWL7_9HELO|nr:uncharacterized protein PAC_07049 [Phialocephala subalpina]
MALVVVRQIPKNQPKNENHEPVVRRRKVEEDPGGGGVGGGKNVSDLTIGAGLQDATARWTPGVGMRGKRESMRKKRVSGLGPASECECGRKTPDARRGSFCTCNTPAQASLDQAVTAVVVIRDLAPRAGAGPRKASRRRNGVTVERILRVDHHAGSSIVKTGAVQGEWMHRGAPLARAVGEQSLN